MSMKEEDPQSARAGSAQQQLGRDDQASHGDHAHLVVGRGLPVGCDGVFTFMTHAPTAKPLGDGQQELHAGHAGVVVARGLPVGCDGVFRFMKRAPEETAAAIASR